LIGAGEQPLVEASRTEHRLEQRSELIGTHGSITLLIAADTSSTSTM
jgi:hypothetical protein